MPPRDSRGSSAFGSSGFSTFSQYIYDPDGGKGVNVYVLDTGIYTEHVEFEGRASSGTTFCGNDNDENGSGTHNAGTIASKKYGVSTQANIISVMVLNATGHGVSDDLIECINWVIKDHQKSVNSNDASFKGSVAFLNSEGISGAGNWDDIRSAISNASDAGIHLAAPTGKNSDACDSIAGPFKALSVGASTIGDERAYFGSLRVWAKYSLRLLLCHNSLSRVTRYLHNLNPDLFA